MSHRGDAVGPSEVRGKDLEFDVVGEGPHAYLWVGKNGVCVGILEGKGLTTLMSRLRRSRYKKEVDSRGL